MLAGRPLGLMLAWLARGKSCACRGTHKDAVSEITFAERCCARLDAMENPAFLALQACERANLEDAELPLEVVLLIPNRFIGIS